MDARPSALDNNSARARLERTARRARYLEDIECVRTGLPLADAALPLDARRSLARRIGVLPGTLERLRRDSLDKVPADAEAAIARAVLVDVDARIARSLASARRLRGTAQRAAIAAAYLGLDLGHQLGAAA